jgi:CHASE2 domain-containing sensor protein
MDFRRNKLFRPAVGAAITALCGLALWATPLGDRWVNASFDYLFRFSERPATNQLALILMDNDSYHSLGQTRGRPWDRRLHAALLNRLADDGCRMVVFDLWFDKLGDSSVDGSLADALRRQRTVVLMAKAGGLQLRYATGQVPDADTARPYLPNEKFLSAADNHWGVAALEPDFDTVVRRHWPFSGEAPKNLHSLPWAAAQLVGAEVTPGPQEGWIRYYSRNGAWDRLSYRLALTQTNYFRDKIVFIGTQPENPVADGRVGDTEDKFNTPYTRWTREGVGGVEILATEFLNLVNGDWLRRPARTIELGGILVVGLLMGSLLCLVRPSMALGLSVGTAVLVLLFAVALAQATNFWFPWLVIGGGQVPCALVWAISSRGISRVASDGTTLVSRIPVPLESTGTRSGVVLPLPEVPDYEVLNPPFAQGAFGRVWLVRNAIGQWQALKAVYMAQFGSNIKPYNREFDGIRRYKPISDKHPGLLRVDFISKQKDEGYFYYVMELGDSITPGWLNDQAKYAPRDLARVRAMAAGRRLPPQECVRIGIALAEGLEFLHSKSLIHGDIKPQNIIFVDGQPKLADVGLVNEALLPGEERTWMGTPGYMPPPPEPPGTVQADIYALGMVLYVVFTGQDPDVFPSVATTLIDNSRVDDFMRLNAVILKACDPDRSRRFRSARELADGLREIHYALQQK